MDGPIEGSGSWPSDAEIEAVRCWTDTPADVELNDAALEARIDELARAAGAAAGAAAAARMGELQAR